MLSTREEIKSALDAYRSYIAANNRRALERFIPVIVNWVPNEDFEEDERSDDRFILRHKLKSLTYRLLEFGAIVLKFSDPTDVLTRWDELVPLLELDGVNRLRLPGNEEDDENTEEGDDDDEEDDGTPQPVAVLADQQYRELKFNEYVTAVEAALKDRVLEEARDSVAFPEELRVLFELGVDGLCGPGLAGLRAMSGCDFWIGLGKEPIEDVVARVGGPGDGLEPWGGTKWQVFDRPDDNGDQDFVIAGGWGIGSGLNAQSCCAVFCRRKDEEEFAWWYTISDEYAAFAFDTIPKLLDYYKDYQQTAFDGDVDELAHEEYLFDGGMF